MPRSWRIRNYIKELSESPTAEKLSFIPPFPILAIEIILLYHAFIINDHPIILFTTILLILSIIEMILVFREIHEHYQSSNFDRELTIRLDDFIIEKRTGNVKKIVEEFISDNPRFESHRNNIYHIACQIMETHKRELWEKTLYNRLEKFIHKKKKDNIKEIIKEFVDKFPEYKKDPDRVYRIAVQFMEKTKKYLKKNRIKKS